jgi:NAD+ diphosphatase
VSCDVFTPGHATSGPPTADHHWFAIHRSSVMVAHPSDLDLTIAATHYLGDLDGVACWAADLVDEEVAAFGTTSPLTDLRALWGTVTEHQWTIAGRAVQIVDWDRTHRFCGRCGTPTELASTDRSRICPKCRLSAYPRLAPAIITVVERGDEILLGRGVNFPLPMFSCLAGFVEPGETLEEAVVREVFEEVGVVVSDVRYQQSQPWPFPHSLMIGFRARWVSGEINIDPNEIAEAHWYRYDELPRIPPGVSVASRLITQWAQERAAG